jgi:Zn-dependent M28 family amino/carboxypeptidase
MLELARVMGVLKKRGLAQFEAPKKLNERVLRRSLGSFVNSSLTFSDSWCPRRTIIFAAWDAEEYGLIGSTEWVEVGWKIAF